MRIVKVRFTDVVLAFDDEQMPITHHFHIAEQGLTIEVRGSDNQAYVYGTLDRRGVTRHAGNRGGNWSSSASDLYAHISAEIFKVAKELGVASHHVWPLVEQLPLFTDSGVDVADALALAKPIKDLLARGLGPAEVLRSLNTTRETIEFVLAAKLPPPRHLTDPFVLDDDQQGVTDPGGW